MSLLKEWSWKHLQNLFNAPPPRPGQELGQSDAEWSIATVHVGDVIGVLEQVGTKMNSVTTSFRILNMS